MNRLHKARWRNILHKAAKVNRLLKKGYIVFDHYDQLATGFKFDDGKLYEGDNKCRVIWSSKQELWNSALDIPIKQYNADRFDKWKAIHPKYVKKI